MVNHFEENKTENLSDIGSRQSSAMNLENTTPLTNINKDASKIEFHKINQDTIKPETNLTFEKTNNTKYHDTLNNPGKSIGSKES